jgi:hypothetical protein
MDTDGRQIASMTGGFLERDRRRLIETLEAM